MNSQETPSGCAGATIKLPLFFLLLIVGAVGSLMVGFAGDSGPNPMFIYLAISLAAFLGTGVVILVTPSRRLLAPTEGTKICWLLFWLSIAQVPVVYGIVALFSQNQREPTTRTDAESRESYLSRYSSVCVTNKSTIPNDRVWVQMAVVDSPKHWHQFPLDPRQTYCDVNQLDHGTQVRYRMYSVAAAKAAINAGHRYDSYSGPAPDWLASAGITFSLKQPEKTCLAVSPEVPESGSGESWKMVSEKCAP